MLGVSRASAGEMLKRLEAEGLIERGEQKEALLTATGRARAERVVRKHRIIERLLTDFMGYTAAEAHVHADELGDTFSEEMVERIAAKLGNPDRCPHGWPVDPDFEQEENLELAALGELEAGTRATIVRLAEHDGELLHWFYDQGLTPGTADRGRRPRSPPPASSRCRSTAKTARSARRPPRACSCARPPEFGAPSDPSRAADRGCVSTARERSRSEPSRAANPSDLSRPSRRRVVLPRARASRPESERAAASSLRSASDVELPVAPAAAEDRTDVVEDAAIVVDDAAAIDVEPRFREPRRWQCDRRRAAIGRDIDSVRVQAGEIDDCVDVAHREEERALTAGCRPGAACPSRRRRSSRSARTRRGSR